MWHVSCGKTLPHQIALLPANWNVLQSWILCPDPVLLTAQKASITPDNAFHHLERHKLHQLPSSAAVYLWWRSRQLLHLSPTTHVAASSRPVSGRTVMGVAVITSFTLQHSTAKHSTARHGTEQHLSQHLPQLLNR